MTTIKSTLSKLKRYDPVKVTWIDAFHPYETSWVDPEEIDADEELVVETVGHFWERGQRQITIVRNRFADCGIEEKVEGVFHIPIGCILEIRGL